MATEDDEISGENKSNASESVCYVSPATTWVRLTSVMK